MLVFIIENGPKLNENDLLLVQETKSAHAKVLSSLHVLY